MRLVIPHRGIQPGDVPVGDVGWVGHDAVELPQTLGRFFQRVELHGHRLTGKAGAADVLAADAQRALVDLPQHHMAAGDIFRHR